MEKKFSLPGKKCVSKPRQSRKRPGCIRLFVCPTTGGRLEISVSPRESILGLKTALARKLKTNPARITLIYKEKALTSGRLVDYQIPEDSLLTLLPNMESGLSLHQSEKSITQALENLSETQVNDFLSGRAPLMLAIRMGENMVFVQLQLSTVTQGQGKQQVQAQANPQLQQTPSVTPMTQRTATLLSQRGLSASALAQATRCLSRRIHHLHGRGTASTSTSNPMNLNPSQTSSTNLPMATPTSSLSSSPPSKPSQQPPANATTANPSTSPMMVAAASGSTITPLSSLPTAHSAMTRGPLSLAPSAVKSPSPGPSMLHLPTSNPLPAQNQPSSSGTLPSPPPSPGAVMNSLKHVGSGIYSGTFSGTLDSSLQEANGQPRRSVNTILHILNDLLVASPASSPQPQPMTPTTPTNLSGATSPSSTSSHKSQHHQVFFNPNSMLTPPPSPKQVDTTGSFLVGEKADNELLRGKMQRVQMMLAQKKEQRGKRRQAIAPYSLPKNQNGPSTDCLSSFLAGSTTDIANSSLCKSQQLASAIPASSSPSASASPGTASERPRMCTHMEDGSECCSSYGKKGLEHDSLVV